MNTTHSGEHSDASEPRRPLRSNFTERVLRNAATAKRRATNRQRRVALRKDLFTMKSIKFLRTVPGAIAAVAVIATGSVGVYAMTNWFDGNVAVTQDTDSTFSVDLSSCKDVLPGVDATKDLSHLQYKITGQPHISAPDLRKQLLGECEATAVAKFYAQKYPQAGFVANIEDFTADPMGQNASKYAMLTARVVAIGDDGTIVLSSTGAKGASFGTIDGQGKYSPVKTFTLAAQAPVYNQSKDASLGDLAAGDNVVFVAYAASAATPMVESKGVVDYSDVQVISLFKTQYDDGWTSFNYVGQNVMPLDMYNAMQKSAPAATQ
jgi:hypothetical protein